MKFDDIINSKLKQYNVLSEDAPEIQQDIGGDENTAPEPTPSDASPTPNAGGSTENPTPVYDKPYIDLAKILYKALRIEFNELDNILQNRILNLKPDDIKSDKQAVGLFKEIEDVLNDHSGVNQLSSEFGPGANV